MIITSLVTAGTNSHQETTENVNAFATDFVTPGIVGSLGNASGVAPMTGGFAVNAQGTPNMTVAISAGKAWVPATPASQNNQTLRVRNTATISTTISANSSGSTKYDWVYLAVDASKAANPAADASDVTSVAVSRSSSSTADNGTPPTFGYCIGIVAVANGSSSITNGNITDKRTTACVGMNWQSWTPTFTGLAGGTLNYATYTQVGKLVHYKLMYTMTGANISGTAGVQFTLPTGVSANSDPHTAIGWGAAEQGSGAYQYLQVFGFTPATIFLLSTSGPYVTPAGLRATIPFTWGNGDVIALQGFYEPA